MSASQLSELTTLIEQLRFFKLKSAYGSSPQERHYSYRLIIQWKEKKKTVLFRSNPSTASAPKAFSEIEKMLIQFTR